MFTSIIDSEQASNTQIKQDKYQKNEYVLDKFDGESKSIFDILGKFDKLAVSKKMKALNNNLDLTETLGDSP